MRFPLFHRLKVLASLGSDSWRTVAILLLATASVSAGAAAVTYTYDNLGRLKSIAFDDGTSQTFNLDAAGNRTGITTAVDTTAPSVPTGLAGTVVTANRIDLTWTASTDTGGAGIGGYKVFRGGIQIATSSIASFSDTSVVGSTTYTYTVAAYDNANNTSAQSTSISKSTPDVTPPSVPTGLNATAPTSTTVNLTWTASTDNSGGSGVAGYRVYRGGVQKGTSATTSFSDTTVAGSTAYSYTVASYDVANNASAQSTAKNIATPDTIAPSVPTGVTATAISSTQVNVTWTASTDTGGSGLAGYRIYRGGTLLGTSATASYTDVAVVGSTAYSYKVASYDNAANASAQSPVAATVTTPAGPPAVPTLSTSAVVATAGVYYTLSWTSAMGATRYELSETNTNATPNTTTQIYSGTALSFQRSRMQGTWPYQVHSCNAVACSASSNTVWVEVCPAAGCQ